MNYEYKAITIDNQPRYFDTTLNYQLIPYLNDGWEILLQTPVTQIEEEIYFPIEAGIRKGDKITKLCVTFILRKKIIL